MKPPLPDRAALANQAQMLLLDALLANTRFSCHDLAFQGGTSLKLMAGSPRFSEDLDFLLREDHTERLIETLAELEQTAGRALRALDPQLSLTMKNKTGDRRLIAFDAIVTHAGHSGSVRVKLEFWPVTGDYLEQYPAALGFMRQLPTWQGHLQHAVPTADLHTILADKAVAVAYRGRMKPRDIFDIWWLQSQLQPGSATPASVARQALHNRTAYDAPDEPLSFADRLRAYAEALEQPDAAATFNADMAKWLPPSTFQQLIPAATAEILATTAAFCREVADALPHVSAARGRATQDDGPAP